jgi:hypothetical protein
VTLDSSYGHARSEVGWYLLTRHVPPYSGEDCRAGPMSRAAPVGTGSMRSLLDHRAGEIVVSQDLVDQAAVH